MNSKRAIEASTFQDLYERDYLWLQETSRLLKTKIFIRLDLENLIEEIESLSAGNKRRNERNRNH